MADRGDGAGRDYFEAGIDHYKSWITVDGGAPQQEASTAAPRTITATALPHQDVCVHVEAFDRVGNATPDEVACGYALGAPPMPAWLPLASVVAANPSPVGLVGLESWLWLDPLPRPMVAAEPYEGVQYRLTATPIGAEWDSGDGVAAGCTEARASARHFQRTLPPRTCSRAHSRLGYPVRAQVSYALSWTALIDGTWSSPYAMGITALAAVPLDYPVEQAQPELLRLGA